LLPGFRPPTRGSVCGYSMSANRRHAARTDAGRLSCVGELGALADLLERVGGLSTPEDNRVCSGPNDRVVPEVA
jgi:hypothetical protein